MLWTIQLMMFVMMPHFGERAKVRKAFALELMAMRQQLEAYSREKRKPRLGKGFRMFWVMLRRLWPRWKDACVLVKPVTVIAWHRAGFRLFWKWKSRKRGGRRDCAVLIALIRRIAAENPTWGAPRIHGELIKLGLRVCERTVSRYMPKRSFKGDDLMNRRQNWKTFLENHKEVIAAMDFLVVPTWSYRQLYILVILDHGRRIVRHLNVTANPFAEWVKQ